MIFTIAVVYLQDLMGVTVQQNIASFVPNILLHFLKEHNGYQVAQIYSDPAIE